MQISFKVNGNPPPLDDVDKYAKILFNVFNEGVNPDTLYKGVFSKPYSRFDDYESLEKLQEPTFFCDKYEEFEGKRLPFSYGWREWGVNAQKILKALEQNNVNT